jgi:hypothetical protein
MTANKSMSMEIKSGLPPGPLVAVIRLTPSLQTFLPDNILSLMNTIKVVVGLNTACRGVVLFL